MLNFTTRKTFLILSFDLDEKEREKMNRFLAVLEKQRFQIIFPAKAV